MAVPYTEIYESGTDLVVDQYDEVGTLIQSDTIAQGTAALLVGDSVLRIQQTTGEILDVEPADITLPVWSTIKDLADQVAVIMGIKTP